MRNPGRIILIAGPLVVATIAVILLLVSLAPRIGAHWTNDAQVSSPRALSPRHVLWEPAQPLLSAMRDPQDAYEPRLSPDGTMLAFVRRRPGANADLFIARIQPDGRWAEAQPLLTVNTDADELGPEFARDGQSLYFYSDRPGGLGGYDLWISARDGESFSAPRNLGPAVNTPYNEYAPAITPDGRRLFFSSNRPKPGEVRPDSPAWPATLREQRTRHDYDIYIADVSQDAFRDATVVASLATSADEGSPAVSPAGDFLYFASDRAGGFGAFDLYRARLRGGQPLSPENLGPAINTARNELDPGLGAHGFLLVFSSDREHVTSLPGAPADADKAPSHTANPGQAPSTYALYQSISREVYLAQDDGAAGRLLGQLWHDTWPWLVLLILLGALAWLVTKLWKSELLRRRIAQLSLLARCVLASMVIHALLGVLFAAWQVSQHVGEWLQSPGGTRIIVSSGTSPDGIASQIRSGIAAVDADTSPVVSLPTLSTPDVPILNATFVPAMPTPQNVQTPRAASSRDFAVSSHTAHVESNPRVADVPAAEPSSVSLPGVPTANPPVSEASTAAAVALAVPAPASRVMIADTPIELTPATPTTLSISTQPLGRSTEFTTTTTHRAGSDAAKTLEVHVPPSDANSIASYAVPKSDTPTSSSVEPSLGEQSAPAPSFPGAPSSQGLLAAPNDLPIGSPAPSALPTNKLAAAVTSSEFSSSPRKETNRQSSISPESASAILPPQDSGSDLTARVPSAATSSNAQASSAEASVTGAGVPPIGELAASPPFPSLAGSTIGSAPAASTPAPLAPQAPRPGAAGFEGPSTTTRSASSSVDSRTASAPSGPGDDFAASFTTRVPEAPAKPSPPITPTENFAQRTPEVRGDVLRQTGGTPESEQAVQRALAWLAAQQENDGHWGTRSFDATCECGGKGEVEADTAMTSLALLCFLGAGHTHQEAGPYTQAVGKALAWLTSRQSPSGDLRQGETMYGQTVACVALCEAFAMTRDQSLAPTARRAFEFMLAPSGRGGTTRTDMAVLGWHVMAVESARRAGLTVPPSALASIQTYLDSASTPSSPGRYSYRKDDRPSADMTAEAMFVQQLLGRARTEPRMEESARFILQTPPRWRDGAPTHYWYYATLALFQHQGEAWKEWNEAIVPELLKNQRTDAKAAGSWDPKDEWSRTCGRVYQTAICTLSLEVYYRYRPAGMTPVAP